MWFTDYNPPPRPRAQIDLNGGEDVPRRPSKTLSRESWRKVRGEEKRGVGRVSRGNLRNGVGETVMDKRPESVVSSTVGIPGASQDKWSSEGSVAGARVNGEY